MWYDQHMKFERSHQLALMIAVVMIAIGVLIIILLPARHVTGSTTTTSGSLPVISADGQSLGQSIGSDQLVPAPTNGLQSSGSSSVLQPTGSIK